MINDTRSREDTTNLSTSVEGSLGGDVGSTAGVDMLLPRTDVVIVITTSVTSVVVHIETAVLFSLGHDQGASDELGSGAEYEYEGVCVPLYGLGDRRVWALLARLDSLPWACGWPRPRRKKSTGCFVHVSFGPPAEAMARSIQPPFLVSGRLKYT